MSDTVNNEKKIDECKNIIIPGESDGKYILEGEYWNRLTEGQKSRVCELLTFMGFEERSVVNIDLTEASDLKIPKLEIRCMGKLIPMPYKRFDQEEGWHWAFEF